MVKPELLVWARESARLTVEEAAKKIGQDESRLLSWEKGEAKPTIGQLRELGRIYRRPLAVFFLSKPPKAFQALQDHRRLSRELIGRQSPELAFEIRRARYRREIALDLYEEMLGKPKPFGVTASVAEEPEEVAGRLRELAGLRRADVARWKNHYDGFNDWRGRLEDAGVLVFQASDVEVAEMRGFSISAPVFPVVVVNIKDAVSARVFSMLHEAAHLTLREGGLCDVLDETSTTQERVEVFCNRVAGAALMPKQWLLREDIVRDQKGPRWSDEAIVTLSQRYRVSREALVRRLLILGQTTEDFYRRKRKEYQAEYDAQQKAALQSKAAGLQAGGFAPPDRIAVSTAGPFFVRLVLNSYHQEKITSNDLASFLEVRLKHIPKIEHAVLPQAAAGA